MAEAQLGATPSGSTDGANKGYVDGASIPSSQISDATTAGRNLLTAANATSALALLTPLQSAQSATVATSESTSSTTYADLTTTTDSVTVTVGSTGIALVFLSSVVTYTSGSSVAAYLGVAVSGATTQAAADQYSIGELIPSQAIPLTGVVALTGLTAGSTTFKMKYRMNTGTAAFANRRITVVLL